MYFMVFMYDPPLSLFRSTPPRKLCRRREESGNSFIDFCARYYCAVSGSESGRSGGLSPLKC